MGWQIGHVNVHHISVKWISLLRPVTQHVTSVTVSNECVQASRQLHTNTINKPVNRETAPRMLYNVWVTGEGVATCVSVYIQLAERHASQECSGSCHVFIFVVRTSLDARDVNSPAGRCLESIIAE